MNDQAIRFRLGIFVLTALILLGVLITLFGGFPNYFRPTDTYYIMFTNAQGVAAGTPVTRSGVRIGQVKTVELDDETGKVKVTIGVDHGYTLRMADKATLSQGLLGGDSSIAFVPPPEDQKVADRSLWPPGSTIPGQSPLDTGQLVQKMGEMMPIATDVLVELKTAFQRLDKLTPVLEDTFKEFRGVAKTARDVLPEFKKTGEDIRDLTKAVKEELPGLRKTSEEFQTAARNVGKLSQRLDTLIAKNEDKITVALDRLQETLKKVSETLSEDNQKNLRETLANVRKASDRFDGIAKNADDFFKDGKSAFKLLGDAVVRIDGLLLNLDKATRGFGERGPIIMKNLESGSDQLNKAMADLRELLQYVARNEGTVQKLITDPSLYNNLNDSAAMVTRILPRLDRVLRDVEIFSDKIARHPEVLGVSGAIRPSSGAKEAPPTLPWWRTVPNYP